MNEFGKVKIIVAGDSGVGKTALVHLLCYNKALVNPSWTVGCSVDLIVCCSLSYQYFNSALILY